MAAYVAAALRQVARRLESRDARTRSELLENRSALRGAVITKGCS